MGRFYGRLARTLRAGYRIITPRWRTDTPPDHPVVFVVHHQNMYGPVHMLGLLPAEQHIWSLYVFLSRATCFDQFYNYTFRTRYGLPKPLACIVAKPVSAVATALLSSFGAIEAYHDARSVRTMRASLAALLRGEHITVSPDVEYSSGDAAVGTIYQGFLMLGKLYAKQAGRELDFVPVYVSRKTRSIRLGAPLHSRHDLSTADAVQDLADRMTASINALGIKTGDIHPDQLKESATCVSLRHDAAQSASNEQAMRPE